jgi:hypothetical protein
VTGTSAHRDVALWRYERPSRGYRGFHLQAQDPSARRGFRRRLAGLAFGEVHRFRLRETLSGWPREGQWPAAGYTELLLTVGRAQEAAETSGVSLSIEASERDRLIAGLDAVSFHDERSFEVETTGGSGTLWLWWDLAK